jgi:hypothetical protein
VEVDPKDKKTSTLMNSLPVGTVLYCRKMAAGRYRHRNDGDGVKDRGITVGDILRVEVDPKDKMLKQIGAFIEVNCRDSRKMAAS